MECSEVYKFTHCQTKVLMISQFLSYIFPVFVNNLAVSVQVRGSPNSKIISPRDPNRTPERAKSLESRYYRSIRILWTNYLRNVTNFRCTRALTPCVVFDKDWIRAKILHFAQDISRLLHNWDPLLHMALVWVITHPMGQITLKMVRMGLYVIIWWAERNEQTERPNAHRTNDYYPNSAEVSAQ